MNWAEWWSYGQRTRVRQRRERRGGQAPLRDVLFLCSFLCGRFYCQGTKGRGGGTPHYDCAGWSGVRKGFMYKNPSLSARGSGKAAAMALRAPSSGIQIKDNKQTSTRRHLTFHITIYIHSLFQKARVAGNKEGPLPFIDNPINASMVSASIICWGAPRPPAAAAGTTAMRVKPCPSGWSCFRPVMARFQTDCTGNCYPTDCQYWHSNYATA